VLNQKGGAVTLRLTPASMGTVRIHLQIEGSSVNAQFHTQTPGARTLLQQQLTTLRTALEGQGLTVDRLSVQSGSNTSSSQFNSQQNSDSSSNEGRSRGQYAQQQGGRQQRGDQPAADFAQWIDQPEARDAFALAEQE